ncbi:uncharacterized protein BDCG_17369 [Blastomyces dermatitidis ER-3]|uniref:Uncharacterized protein n=2 Tax=Blastomyces TaxID=229219 RepID=A0A179UN38_BLAGS|nr:uncharacterized protein BDBG_17229 [Blastomyces gilchristii SLH14081]XP_045281801.1 uncharacterized protein BDCG_17369 [Blastomyces dermatitidis ER-3]EQL33837.1 hypothetical protein BDFG_04221 [Blastomyces dermatitidis ATCC 26199]OAT02074.1 hypothetical protein BDCG_17369 [Blastomyces dermatitidis ER-3]OAT09485.1 hypothetical protein BDBG_17229 [Blastomyces gilchristii SLH14081]
MLLEAKQADIDHIIEGPNSASPTTTVTNKEARIRGLAFLNTPGDGVPRQLPGVQAHALITPERVDKALFGQSTKKAPGMTGSILRVFSGSGVLTRSAWWPLPGNASAWELTRTPGRLPGVYY